MIEFYIKDKLKKIETLDLSTLYNILDDLHENHDDKKDVRSLFAEIFKRIENLRKDGVIK